MRDVFRDFDTKVVHEGEPERRAGTPVSLPVYQTAMFIYADEGDYHDIKYIRLNNTPNHEALHAKLAALEGGEAALVTASGMAAITTSLLSVLGRGGHLLAQDCLYGGTHTFLTRELPTLGGAATFIDAEAPDTWEAHLRSDTRAIYVESITNPQLQVADLEAVVEFARAHDLVSLIDNTFATPVNFNPLALGFDLVLHSCTKYLNGHSDLVAGCVVGRGELIAAITHRLNHLGGTLDPHACFLLHRGMKTLALRVRQQNASALALARALAEHPAVARVHYPGLESHPGHPRAKRLFRGYGGMLSFEVEGGREGAEALMAALTIPLEAVSLGGVESLVIRPAATSHAGMSAAERERAGIGEGLVRVSVGIESTAELIEDFQRALARRG